MNFSLPPRVLSFPDTFHSLACRSLILSLYFLVIQQPEKTSLTAGSCPFPSYPLSDSKVSSVPLFCHICDQKVKRYLRIRRFGMGTGVSPGRIATRKVSVIQKLIASASRAISNRSALLDVGVRPISSVMAGLLSCRHAHPFHAAVRTAH